MSYSTMNTAEELTPESGSVEVPSRRSRLLYFRALLDSLEYEYSVLLHDAPAESLPEEELGHPSGESAEQEKNDSIPMEGNLLLAAQHPVRHDKQFISGRGKRASPSHMPQDSSLPLEEEHLILKRSTSAQVASSVGYSSEATWEDNNSSPQSPRAAIRGISGENRISQNLFRSLFASRTRTLDLSSNRKPKTFPLWWNPDKDVLREMMLRGAALEKRSDYSTHKLETPFVLSPIAFHKLCWDFVGFALILYDSWATPFYLIFISDALELSWLTHGNIVITCFLALDIILSFNTGVVVKRGICFERREIVRQYLQGWFWLDLAATIPYDLVYDGAGFAGLLRFMKFAKYLRILRLCRLMRLTNTLELLKRTENDYFQVVKQSKRFLAMLGILIVLLWNVHFFTCLWLALSDVHEDTLSKAMRVYFDTYVSIFFALSNGTQLHAQSTSKKLIEMVISAEKFVMICLFSAYAIFEALVLYGDTAKSRHLRDQVQQYMARHHLPVGIQIEVLSGLEEARSARALQKDFITLTSSDLPSELRQKIAIELWESDLMKLGLFARISEWDEEFCRSLSLLCREEVFATDVVLFREHDLSIAAYCILSGEIKISCALIDRDIPNFKEGTWVGESSLVNPSFRRGLKAVSLCLLSVMVVSSADFQRLLKSSNLWHHFEEFMNRELCLGLCGRCGSIGDHFFDHCPDQDVQRLFSFRAAKNRRFPCWRSAEERGSVQDQANIREMVDFLYHFESLHLLPYLQELQVYSLSQLQDMDSDFLIALLEKLDPPAELSPKDKKVLSTTAITMYRDVKTKGMEEHCVIDNNKHFIFLSHYKVEAGTEAALMRSELERIINDSLMEDDMFRVPIFLDSEDLTTLTELEDHVKKSFNVVLLLTRGVLSRPWVLVELVTAVRCGTPVVPILVVKPGAEFTFPTEGFYADVLDGKFLDEAGQQLLSGCNIEFQEVEQTLRKVFQKIAVEYSPHRPAHIRQAELQALLRCCHVGQRPFQALLGLETASPEGTGTLSSSAKTRLHSLLSGSTETEPYSGLKRF